MSKEKKVHTGFRLSQSNLELLEEYERSLGINKTNVMDMILTVIRKDDQLMIDLIRKALEDRLN